MSSSSSTENTAPDALGRDTDPAPAIDDAASASDAGGEPVPHARTQIGSFRRRLIKVASIVFLIIACMVTGWIYAFQYHKDEQTGPAVADKVMKTASTGAVAVLSFKPETVAADFEAAKSHLTEGFLVYYDQFTQHVVGPAVREKGLHATATVVQAAVSELHPESATVLLFVNQSTASAETPNPSVTAACISVGLRKVGHDWLIASFEPV